MILKLYLFVCSVFAGLFVFGQQRPFVTEWVADSVNEIEIRTRGTASFTYTHKYNPSVQGTGSINQEKQVITVPEPGPYIFEFSDTENFTLYAGGFEDIYGDNQALAAVRQWGDVDWNTDMSFAFRQSQAEFTAQDVPDFSQVTNFYGMFYESAVTDIPHINQWDTSAAQTMSGMFMNAALFNGDLSAWNTSSVTDMNSMFLGTQNFNSDISGWNTGAVTDMGGMFAFTGAFNQNLSAWNTINVTDISGMFFQAVAFNGDVSGWNTSNVLKMTTVFRAATSFDQDVSSWDVSNVTAMTNMFSQSGYSCVNYAKALQAWSQQDVKSGVALGAIGVKYGSAAAPYRSSLVQNKGWVITGDVFTEGCDAVLSTSPENAHNDDITVISPVLDELRIISKNPVKYVTVYDNLGRTVISFHGPRGNAAALQSGVYLLQINTSKGHKWHRVLKK